MDENMANQSQTEAPSTETQESAVNQTEQTSKTTAAESAQATEATTTQEVTPAIKVKFNHEEKEIPYEEATTLIQKGMNYDKIFQQHAELQKKWEATQQQQEKQTLTEAYQSTVAQVAAEYGADPEALLEIAETLIAKHPDVIEARGIKAKEAEVLTQKQMQEKITADAAAFRANYPDVDINKIPAEVWEKVDKGLSLTDSYQIYENKILKEKIAAQEKALQVKEANERNAATSPGSVTGQGATTADFISFETFEQNRGNQKWVKDNYSRIQESRKKW